MIDPFKSARRRLARAKEHILDITSRRASFSQGKPFKRVVETNPENGLREHKIRLTSDIPDKITDLTYESVESLRSALDQATYAIANMCNVTRPNRVQFPIADTLWEFENILSSRLKEFPSAILLLFHSFKTYETGNCIWALNRIRRQTVHRLIVPVGFTSIGTVVFTNLADARITPEHFRAGRELRPTWNVEKNEMIYMVASPADRFNYNVVCTFDFAFGSAVEGVGGRRVLYFLDSAAREVDRIIGNIEAEARRIGLVGSEGPRV
jgi:hypothetical protein